MCSFDSSYYLPKGPNLSRFGRRTDILFSCKLIYLDEKGGIDFEVIYYLFCLEKKSYITPRNFSTVVQEKKEHLMKILYELKLCPKPGLKNNLIVFFIFLSLLTKIEYMCSHGLAG